MLTQDKKTFSLFPKNMTVPPELYAVRGLHDLKNFSYKPKNPVDTPSCKQRISFNYS